MVTRGLAQDRENKGSISVRSSNIASLVRGHSYRGPFLPPPLFSIVSCFSLSSSPPLGSVCIHLLELTIIHFFFLFSQDKFEEIGDTFCSKTLHRECVNSIEFFQQTPTKTTGSLKKRTNIGSRLQVIEWVHLSSEEAKKTKKNTKNIRRFHTT